MKFLDGMLQANGIKLQETYIGISSDDPDRSDNINNGFRRLSKTQNERDLMPLEQQRQTEIALFLYDSNPLAKRIIDLVNSFVTGDGFNFNAKNSRVLDVLKRFWEDPVNDWPMKQLDRFRQLSLLGEQLWPVAVRRTDGRVRMGYVDPANIEEICPDPYNPEIFRTARIVQGYHPDGAKDLPTCYSLVNVDERYLSPSYNKLNFYPEPYGAFYFAINKPSNATRGRSDIITVFDWLDLYDQHLFGAAERATYLTDFIWDVEMKGADEDALKKWHRENAMPRGAAMRVHNENMKWAAIAPNLNAADSEMMAKLIKNHILTAIGLPPSWVSDPGDTNRSTGVAMAGPILKSLAHRQRFCRGIITKILQFVVDQAVLAGRLYGLTPKDLEFEVLSPSLTPSDMSALTATMLKLSQSIKLAEDQGWVSHPTAAKVFLKFLTELGVQVSIEDEITKVENIVPKSTPAGQDAEGAMPPVMEEPPIGMEGGEIDDLMPGDPTGSELLSPVDQLLQQLRDRMATGSTVSRKGNPV